MRGPPEALVAIRRAMSNLARWTRMCDHGASTVGTEEDWHPRLQATRNGAILLYAILKMRVFNHNF